MSSCNCKFQLIFFCNCISLSHILKSNYSGSFWVVYQEQDSCKSWMGPVCPLAHSIPIQLHSCDHSCLSTAWLAKMFSSNTVWLQSLLAVFSQVWQSSLQWELVLTGHYSIMLRIPMTLIGHHKETINLQPWASIDSGSIFEEENVFEHTHRTLSSLTTLWKIVFLPTQNIQYVMSQPKKAWPNNKSKEISSPSNWFNILISQTHKVLFCLFSERK